LGFVLGGSFTNSTCPHGRLPANLIGEGKANFNVIISTVKDDLLFVAPTVCRVVLKAKFLSLVLQSRGRALWQILGPKNIYIFFILEKTRPNAFTIDLALFLKSRESDRESNLQERDRKKH
jgi:hypothetical protein